MSHKIQIIVDDYMDSIVREKAKKMGLSVSSYARLVLSSILPKKNKRLLHQALDDLKSGGVEEISLEQFSRQLKKL